MGDNSVSSLCCAEPGKEAVCCRMGLVVKSLLLAAMVALSAASVTFRIMERWYGGFKMEFTLTADSELNSWSIDMELSGTIDALQVGIELS